MNNDSRERRSVELGTGHTEHREWEHKGRGQARDPQRPHNRSANYRNNIPPSRDPTTHSQHKKNAGVEQFPSLALLSTTSVLAQY